jgi:hypothetical protein
MDVSATFNGPVEDNLYYFFAFNSNGDDGLTGPLPVAAGPYWGNGWGTGTISYYVQYTAGDYTVWKVNLVPTLTTSGDGITAVSGSPTSAEAGSHTLTVTNVALGTPTVSGAGMIQSVTNDSDQNAGTLSIQTSAAGQTVAGGVTFTPAANGGHALTGAALAAINALNAGGVALTTSSLNDLGLTLDLSAAVAGTQTVVIPPAVGTVSDVFNSSSRGTQPAVTRTLTANSSTPTATPPIPGVTITTSDLNTSGPAAVITLTVGGSDTLLGRPYDRTLPAGGNQLRFTLDMATFGGASNLSFNIITTTRLITDPTITDPRQHCYDGMGLYGNNYITFVTNNYTTYRNSSALYPVVPNAPTLLAPLSGATDAQRNAIDIIDWTVTLRRL